MTNKQFNTLMLLIFNCTGVLMAAILKDEQTAKSLYRDAKEVVSDYVKQC